MSKKKQSPDEEPEEGTTPEDEPKVGATPVGKYKKEGAPDNKYKKEGAPVGKYKKEGAPVGKYKKEGPPDDKSEEVGANMSEEKRTPGDGTSDEESEEEPSTPGEPKMPNQGGKPNGNGGRDWKRIAKNAAIGAPIGAAAVLLGVPACIAGLGFTGAGIAAGSIAAKMMSVAAIANGGGVAAGSTVAMLQSIGAAGLSVGAQIGLAGAGGSLGAAIGASLPTKKDPDETQERVTPGDKPKEVATRNPGEVPDPEVLPGSLHSPPPSQELEP